MAQYEAQEELMLSGYEIFDIMKAARLWAYPKSKIEIDLEAFTNILLECDKAGKDRWTDKELILVSTGLRNAQAAVDYKVVARDIVWETS